MQSGQCLIWGRVAYICFSRALVTRPMNEIRFHLRNLLSRTPVLPAARSDLNRVRNLLWEAKVIRHRNRIREEARGRGVQYRAVEAAKRIRANVTRKGIKPKAKGELRPSTLYGFLLENGYTLDTTFANSVYERS